MKKVKLVKVVTLKLLSQMLLCQIWTQVVYRRCWVKWWVVGSGSRRYMWEIKVLNMHRRKVLCKCKSKYPACVLSVHSFILVRQELHFINCFAYEWCCLFISFLFWTEDCWLFSCFKAWEICEIYWILFITHFLVFLCHQEMIYNYIQWKNTTSV